jgi:hypothetical protein
MSAYLRTWSAVPLVAAALAAVVLAIAASSGAAPPDHARLGAKDIRVMQYNILDVRTEDLKRNDNPRVEKIAAVIQRLRPDILLLNEIAYDQHGAIHVDPDDREGQNARRFVENYLKVPQAPDLDGIVYHTYTAPSNTGIQSGHDLNRDGIAMTVCPSPPGTLPDGGVAPHAPGGQICGEDALGFGTFPGHYGMAVLVRPQFKILADRARTFQKFLWKDMPGAMLPTVPATGASWYPPATLEIFRLSSKSHWDVPVRLPGGPVVHVLASHPTPRSFDGPEDRNGKRNFDENRFWGDYINDASYIYDDAGVQGGLAPDASFFVMGDLNHNAGAVRDHILANPRVNDEFVPLPLTGGNLNRIDYALPSTDMTVLGGFAYGLASLYQGWGEYPGRPSDHYPVVVDVRVPHK